MQVGLGVVLGIAMGPSVLASADELSDLKAQMRTMQEQMHAMQARIDGLETKRAAPAPTEAYQPEPSLEPLANKVEFHGSVDLTYLDYGKQGYRSGDSTFEVYEAYLAALGNVAEDVRIYLEPRYEHGSDTIELRQGYLDWEIAKPLTLRAGKFYMPIGRYQQSYYNSLRKLVEYHYSMRLVNVAPWEDVGVQALGTVPLGDGPMKLDYALAVVNGLDADYTQQASSQVRNARQNRDNNSNKTIGGRLGFSPWKGFEVGLSYNTGAYDNNARHRLDFYDADIAYRLGDLELTSEFVLSRAESNSGLVKTYGYYVEGAYKVLKDFWGMNYLELVAAFDTLDPGQALNDRFRLANGQQVRKFSFGLDFSPRQHFLIKTEYALVEENKPSIDNNAFLVQAVIDF
jgi:hypothetical protein